MSHESRLASCQFDLLSLSALFCRIRAQAVRVLMTPNRVYARCRGTLNPLTVRTNADASGVSCALEHPIVHINKYADDGTQPQSAASEHHRVKQILRAMRRSGQDDGDSTAAASTTRGEPTLWWPLSQEIIAGGVWDGGGNVPRGGLPHTTGLPLPVLAPAFAARETELLERRSLQ